MLIKTIQRNRRANIHVDRIMYVESVGAQITFYLFDGMQIVCRIALVEVKNLFPALERISDNCLINEKELRCVDLIGGYYYFKMSNGDKLRTSSSSKFVKEFFKNYDR
jgi:DNA-binding LytR/AlgR family response regulator